MITRNLGVASNDEMNRSFFFERKKNSVQAISHKSNSNLSCGGDSIQASAELLFRPTNLLPQSIFSAAKNHLSNFRPLKDSDNSRSSSPMPLLSNPKKEKGDFGEFRSSKSIRINFPPKPERLTEENNCFVPERRKFNVWELYPKQPENRVTINLKDPRLAHLRQTSPGRTKVLKSLDLSECQEDKTSNKQLVSLRLISSIKKSAATADTSRADKACNLAVNGTSNKKCFRISSNSLSPLKSRHNTNLD